MCVFHFARDEEARLLKLAEELATEKERLRAEAAAKAEEEAKRATELAEAQRVEEDRKLAAKLEEELAAEVTPCPLFSFFIFCSGGLVCHTF